MQEKNGAVVIFGILAGAFAPAFLLTLSAAWTKMEVEYSLFAPT